MQDPPVTMQLLLKVVLVVMGYQQTLLDLLLIMAVAAVEVHDSVKARLQPIFQAQGGKAAVVAGVTVRK